MEKISRIFKKQKYFVTFWARVHESGACVRVCKRRHSRDSSFYSEGVSQRNFFFQFIIFKDTQEPSNFPKNRIIFILIHLFRLASCSLWMCACAFERFGLPHFDTHTTFKCQSCARTRMCELMWRENVTILLCCQKCAVSLHFIIVSNIKIVRVAYLWNHSKEEIHSMYDMTEINNRINKWVFRHKQHKRK